MDRGRFDALTRLFASRHSRRAALTSLVSAALFARDRESADVAQGVEAERRRRRRGPSCRLVRCASTNPICRKGACLCNAATASCGTGCCNGDDCQPGTVPAACGANGTACAVCSGACNTIPSGGACA